MYYLIDLGPRIAHKTIITVKIVEIAQCFKLPRGPLYLLLS